MPRTVADVSLASCTAVVGLAVLRQQKIAAARKEGAGDAGIDSELAAGGLGRGGDIELPTAGNFLGFPADRRPDPGFIHRHVLGVENRHADAVDRRGLIHQPRSFQIRRSEYRNQSDDEYGDNARPGDGGHLPAPLQNQVENGRDRERCQRPLVGDTGGGFKEFDHGCAWGYGCFRGFGPAERIFSSSALRFLRTVCTFGCSGPSAFSAISTARRYSGSAAA